MDNEKQEYNSMYRALVVDNKDPEKQGRVLVWIPDIMPEVSTDEGIWANSANNPVGGRSNEYDSDGNYMGTCYIPGKGSYVWVFFECGNINRPYYFSALEPGNVKVLPECQVGTEYQNKWVVFKSRQGRCIVISDDPDDRRVEITGKKRKITDSPNGDTGSVYTIDGNQTTILFDEREKKEKILIRTHLGDFFHIDVDEQKLQVQFENDIIIKSAKKISISAEDLHILTSDNMYLTANKEVNLKSNSSFNVESSSTISVKAAADISLDGSNVFQQSGKSGSATGAMPESPEGDRNT